jgi:predicted nucleic acid-binding protein
MGKIRVYADTSVFGGVFDKEFTGPSKEFFRQIQRGKFKLFVSEVVRREIMEAPDKVRLFYNSILDYSDVVAIEKASILLREKYIEKRIVSKKYLDDALHVAVAVTSGCDMIVSWNFKHIVHYEKIQLYNAINRDNGYKDIYINTPAEVIDYEDN